MELFKSKKTMWESFYRTMEKKEQKAGRIITLTLNPSVTQTMVVDGLSAGNENELYTMTADIGGFGIEISRILSGCGYATMCTGLEFSTDKKTLEQFMQVLKIPFVFAEAEGKMRSIVRVLNKNGQPPTEMKEHGWKVSSGAVANLAKKRKKVMDTLKSDDILVLGGSVPGGVSDDAYCSWILGAKEKNVRTILSAEGSLLQKGIEKKPYGIVVSEKNFADYAGCQTLSEEKTILTAKKLLEQGISVVCVYNAKHEILLISQQGVSKGTAYSKGAICECGESSSVIAGLCMAMSSQKEEESLDYILAVVNGTLHKPGNGMCTSTDFEKFFKNK